jgi:hypothetical protein
MMQLLPLKGFRTSPSSEARVGMKLSFGTHNVVIIRDHG